MFAIAKSILLLLVLPTTTLVWGRLNEEQQEEPSEQGERQEQSFTANQAYGGETPFTLDHPTYHGNGCPAGSVEIVPAVGGGEITTMSVLFSRYEAMTSSYKTRDRRSCNMALPVHVKPGLSVGIFKVDYRGNVAVPASLSFSKPYARFDAEYFFAGQRGPIKSRTYTGKATQALDQDWFETDTVGAIAWSLCGGTTNFRINTSILASKVSSRDKDVYITLDTKDINQDGFHFGFTSRPC